MSDPIDRMNDLHHDIEGAPMLPAAEVRRRGDRLRRRRTLAISAGTALAVVAIAAPIALLTGSTTADDRPQPAGPSETDTVTPPHTATLSERNLLRDEDTVFTDEAQWSGATELGEAESTGIALQGCGGANVDLDAAAMIGRSWNVEHVHSLTNVVAEFPTEQAARTAYDAVSEVWEECPGLDPAAGYEASATGVDLPSGTDAQLVISTYDLDPDGTADQGGEAYYQVEEHAAVAVSGNRITLLTHRMPEDENYDDTWWGQTPPVELMLPTAAERLVEAPPSSDPPSEGASDGPPEAEEGLGGDFPLVAGWPRRAEDPSSDGLVGPRSGMGSPIHACPTGDHQVGGFLGPDADASWHAEFRNNPRGSRHRMLVTYATAAQAEAEVERFLADFREACPRYEVGGGPYTAVQTVSRYPSSADEGWVVSGRLHYGEPTPIGRVIVVLRTGPAILLLERSGEAALADAADGGRISEDMVAAAAEPITQMCRWAPDGC